MIDKIFKLSLFSKKKEANGGQKPEKYMKCPSSNQAWTHLLALRASAQADNQQLSFNLSHTHTTEKKQSLNPKEDGRSDQKPASGPGIPTGDTHSDEPGKNVAHRRTKGYLSWLGLVKAKKGRKLS